MKGIWRYIFVLMSAVVLSCDYSSPTAPDLGSVAPTIKISLPKLSATPMRINRVTLKVFGAGMDTLKSEMTISESGTRASGQVKVPSGDSRTFKVDAYLDSIRVYSGQKTQKIESGKVVTVDIPMALQVAALTLSPNDTTVSVGAQFSIKIKVNKVLSLTTLGTVLKFDPALLQVKDVVREDGFLKSAGGSVQQISLGKDNATGQVKLILGILPSVNSVSGDGFICTVTFKTIAAGTTRLWLETDPKLSSDLGLYNQTAQAITALGLDGMVIIR